MEKEPSPFFSLKIKRWSHRNRRDILLEIIGVSFVLERLLYFLFWKDWLWYFAFDSAWLSLLQIGLGIALFFGLPFSRSLSLFLSFFLLAVDFPNVEMDFKEAMAFGGYFFYYICCLLVLVRCAPISDSQDQTKWKPWVLIGFISLSLVLNGLANGLASIFFTEIFREFIHYEPENLFVSLLGILLGLLLLMRWRYSKILVLICAWVYLGVSVSEFLMAGSLHNEQKIIPTLYSLGSILVITILNTPSVEKFYKLI